MPIHDEWLLTERVAPSAEIASRVRSPLVASLLDQAGVRTAEELRLFTSPTLEDLHDPSTIHGIAEACERIEAAIRDGEQIIIYGDYDVDGVTSIVLLKTVLRAIGAEVGWVVPHRIFDGYGLTIPVLDRVLEDAGKGLVITVDCGITSTEAVDHAIARGMDVIITDHHLPPDELPSATVVLNPRQEGCEYPFKDLAGVGVAFKLCCELLRRAGHTMSIASLAKIAALGTIADVAPLVGENRTIARIGLDGLAESRNPGLRVLLRNLGLLGKPLKSFDVGFRIGPRINAAGRIASADTAVRLFECRDEPAAFQIVMELEKLNQRRRTLQDEVLSEAEDQALGQLDHKIIVVGGESWHQGVVGLCAGRLSEKYHRPVLAARIGDQECIGSGRSPIGVDLHGLLADASSVMTRWGGHSRACGFAVERSRWEELAAVVRAAASRIEIPPRRLLAAGELSLHEISSELAGELTLLEPWGESNPEPRFISRALVFEGRREFAENCWSITLSEDGVRRTGVVWPSRADLLESFEPGRRVDCAYTIEANHWEQDGVRLVVEDLR